MENQLPTLPGSALKVPVVGSIRPKPNFEMCLFSMKGCPKSLVIKIENDRVTILEPHSKKYSAQIKGFLSATPFSMKLGLSYKRGSEG